MKAELSLTYMTKVCWSNCLHKVCNFSRQHNNKAREGGLSVGCRLEILRNIRRRLGNETFSVGLNLGQCTQFLQGSPSAVWAIICNTFLNTPFIGPNNLGSLATSSGECKIPFQINNTYSDHNFTRLDVG